MKITKIAIIGAGNMGRAIVHGLSLSSLYNESEIVVSNHTPGKLNLLKEEIPGITTTTDNAKAVKDAEVVILAVKPYVLPKVIEEIKPELDYSRQTIVSVAGGVNLDSIDSMLQISGHLPTVMQVIPTTGALAGWSMTFMAARRADNDILCTVADIMETFGKVAIVDERLMDAGTALCSCGIAYVYKYIQSCVQAGVQLGFKPADALKYMLATMHGALAMLERDGATPQGEIDRVTTPGGMTIKGINELDHAGFNSAVIRAILKPLEK